MYYVLPLIFEYWHNWKWLWCIFVRTEHFLIYLCRNFWQEINVMYLVGFFLWKKGTYKNEVATKYPTFSILEPLSLLRLIWFDFGGMCRHPIERGNLGNLEQCQREREEMVPLRLMFSCRSLPQEWPSVLFRRPFIRWTRRMRRRHEQVWKGCLWYFLWD